jgi:hypothetical protein
MTYEEALLREFENVRLGVNTDGQEFQLRESDIVLFRGLDRAGNAKFCRSNLHKDDIVNIAKLSDTTQLVEIATVENISPDGTAVYDAYILTETEIKERFMNMLRQGKVSPDETLKALEIYDLRHKYEEEYEL